MKEERLVYSLRSSAGQGTADVECNSEPVLVSMEGPLLNHSTLSHTLSLSPASKQLSHLLSRPQFNTQLLSKRAPHSKCAPHCYPWQASLEKAQAGGSGLQLHIDAIWGPLPAPPPRCRCHTSGHLRGPRRHIFNLLI